MARRKKKTKVETLRRIIAIVLLIVAGLGFFKYGLLGLFIKKIAIYLFGGLNLLFLSILLVISFYLFFKDKLKKSYLWKFVAIILAIIGVMLLTHLVYFDNDQTFKIAFENTREHINNMVNLTSRGEVYNPTGSGYIGFYLTYVSTVLIAKEGTKFLSILFILIAFLTFTGSFIYSLILDTINSYKAYRIEKKEEKKQKKLEKKEEKKTEREVIINDNNTVKPKDKITYNSFEDIPKEVKEGSIESLLNEEHIEKDPLEEKEQNNPFYTLPPMDILKYSPAKKNDSKVYIENNIDIIEKTLKEFEIYGHVVEVNQGPAVTQYEMELQTGTKLNRLLSINKEISLALAKKDVRIEAPIPGKNTVGIEVPNENVAMVSLREILENMPENKKDNKLMVALGKNIMGKSFFSEINKTPHLLVAGSTGSGKSVCINCILASILMRAKPTEVKLLLIDPKKVELTMYEDVPHLLGPIVTDSKEASAALQMIVDEMERRFSELEKNKVKNIEDFNNLIDKKNKGKTLGEQLPKMPYVVVVIDELSDLMLVAKKEVEESILRITQKARAAGIHLIAATQRPSTDVITGIIKANIPSRLSFTVASGVDSRTILDMVGAEKLLGRGDSLYLPIGQSSPERIQGAYVSDEELEKLTTFVKKQQKAYYDSKFTEGIKVKAGGANMSGAGPTTDSDADELYDECLKFVIMEGKASTSLLQRRFKIGYNRAANIIDLLEERGVIGGPNGSKPREVLISVEED